MIEEVMVVITLTRSRDQAFDEVDGGEYMMIEL